MYLRSITVIFSEDYFSTQLHKSVMGVVYLSNLQDNVQLVAMETSLWGQVLPEEFTL